MIFPMEVLRVTQGYGVPYKGVPSSGYSHQGSYALDLGGKDGGKDWLVAPCDMTVKRVYGPYNAVWFESDDIIKDVGTTVVMLCLHMDTADLKSLGIKVGKKFKLGEKCYREGTAGKVTGAHVHVELGKGPFMGTGWHKNSFGVWEINDQLIPNEVFRLCNDVKIVKDNGYTWTRKDYSISNSKNIYTVQKGDSWWSIASKQLGKGTKCYALAKANGKSVISVIHPGDVITLDIN